MKSVHKYTVLFFLIPCLAATSACGIKPKDLEPPPGAENTKFPQTYPQSE